MNKSKKAKLEKKGWKIGTTSEFLGLSREEEAYLDLKLSLSRFLQDKRKEKQLTQIQMADLVHSSQSRIAKMEKAEPSVSVDLLVKSLFALGTEYGELAEAIRVGEPTPAYRVQAKSRPNKRAAKKFK